MNKQPIKFKVIKNIKWDDWGRIVVAFREGQICQGEGEFDSQGNLVSATAESPIYEGIEDYIPIEHIELLLEATDHATST